MGTDVVVPRNLQILEPLPVILITNPVCKLGRDLLYENGLQQFSALVHGIN